MLLEILGWIGLFPLVGHLLFFKRKLTSEISCQVKAADLHPHWWKNSKRFAISVTSISTGFEAFLHVRKGCGTAGHPMNSRQGKVLVSFVVKKFRAGFWLSQGVVKYTEQRSRIGWELSPRWKNQTDTAKQTHAQLRQGCPTFWCVHSSTHVAYEKCGAVMWTQRSLPWYGTAARGAWPGRPGDGGLILPFWQISSACKLK